MYAEGHNIRYLRTYVYLTSPEHSTISHNSLISFIVTCVGRSKAPPVPLLPLLHEVYGMANIERSITKLLNDDVILALTHPVIAS